MTINRSNQYFAVVDIGVVVFTGQEGIRQSPWAWRAGQRPQPRMVVIWINLALFDNTSKVYLAI
jgi:hypothetical protein